MVPGRHEILRLPTCASGTIGGPVFSAIVAGIGQFAVIWSGSEPGHTQLLAGPARAAGGLLVAALSLAAGWISRAPGVHRVRVERARDHHR